MVKVVLVGSSGVGKSELFSMWAYGEIIPGGSIIDNYTGAMIVNGREVSLDMWDTRGREDFDRLRPLTYPQTDVFVICFSVVHPWSREDVVTK